MVLLNSDMRVEPDFLPPLLDGFTDEQVFAVSCQIFFSDAERKREETGLTYATWSEGRLHVGHRIDPAINEPYPCFYGGGGSCALIAGSSWSSADSIRCLLRLPRRYGPGLSGLEAWMEGLVPAP